LLGEAEAAGLAFEDEAGAPFMPAEFAAAAFFLQRYTLDVEMLRSLATALVFLPLLISDITLSQSTFLAAAYALAAPISKPTTKANSRLAIPSPIFLITSLPPSG
jgi:hypothetical protein